MTNNISNVYPTSTALCNDLYLTYTQLSQFIEDAYSKCTNYYAENKDFIDKNTPLALKVSYYAIAVLTLCNSPYLIIATSLMGFTLSDRIQQANQMTKETWQKMLAEKKYTSDTKTFVKVSLLIVGLAFLIYLPWGAWAIPAGLSLGNSAKQSMF